MCGDSALFTLLNAHNFSSFIHSRVPDIQSHFASLTGKLCYKNHEESFAFFKKVDVYDKLGSDDHRNFEL